MPHDAVHSEPPAVVTGLPYLDIRSLGNVSDFLNNMPLKYVFGGLLGCRGRKRPPSRELSVPIEGTVRGFQYQDGKQVFLVEH